MQNPRWLEPSEVAHAACFTRDGATLAFGGYRILDRYEHGAYAVKVLRERDEEEELRMPLLRIVDGAARAARDLESGHCADIRAVAFRSDGALVSAGAGELRVCEQSGGSETLGRFDRHVVSALHVGPHDEITIACGWDHVVRVVDTRGVHVLEGHEAIPRNMLVDVAISGDGRFIASGDNLGIAKIWDSRTFECVATVAAGTFGTVRVALTHDGARLATGTSQGEFSVWDVRRNVCLQRWVEHSGPVWCVDIAGEGSLGASGAYDQTLLLYELGRSAPVMTIPTKAPVLTAAFSSDGRELFAASNDGAIWRIGLPERRPV